MGKVIFDVINSIKGGCGKSTYALMTADYYQNKENQLSYIIDLDWYGSSWYSNYKIYYENKDNVRFLNEALLDSKKFISKEYVGILNVAPYSQHKTTYDKINVCMVDPDKVDIGDVEVDLFENTIYLIIKNIIEQNLDIICSKKDDEKQSKNKKNNIRKRNKTKDLHIILDMPPSYEACSNRILNHLLMDQISDLYLLLTKKKLKFEVRLHMISALSPSHIKLNKNFLINFINDRTYSSLIEMLNNKGDLKVYFIVNDLYNLLKDVARSDPFDSVKTALDVENKNEKIFDDYKSFQYAYLNHLDFHNMNEQILNNISLEGSGGSKFINIDPGARKEFEVFIKTLK